MSCQPFRTKKRSKIVRAHFEGHCYAARITMEAIYISAPALGPYVFVSVLLAFKGQTDRYSVNWITNYHQSLAAYMIVIIVFLGWGIWHWATGLRAAEMSSIHCTILGFCRRAYEGEIRAVPFMPSEPPETREDEAGFGTRQRARGLRAIPMPRREETPALGQALRQL